MSTDLLASLRHLPPGAKVTLTVERDDLLHALEEQSQRPDRVVDTSWCAEALGMSREWWASECKAGRVAGAWQEGPRAPWRLRAGAARDHLSQHEASLDRRRSRRRGPRQTRRAS